MTIQWVRSVCLILLASTSIGLSGGSVMAQTNQSQACRACRSDWNVHADLLFLRRDNRNDSSLLSVVADPSQQVTSRDLDRDFSPGLQLELTKKMSSCGSLQFRYLGWFEQSGEASLLTAPGNSVQFETAAPVQSLDGQRTDLSGDSSLHSFEANGLRSITEDVSFLIGLRYLHLEEELSIKTAAAFPATRLDSETENNLFGAQMGLVGDLLRGDRFFLQSFGKAGIFVNDASQSSRIATTVSELRVDTSDDVAAFVGELGIFGGMHLTSAVSITGGYQGLWMSEVALADDQLAETDFFTSSGLGTSGDVLYHGFQAGIQFVY